MMLLNGNPKPKPFFPWTGGKTRLLPEIGKHIPKVILERGHIGRYWEPFLGAGAVFLSLSQGIKQANLSDRLPQLVEAWRAVRSWPEELIAALAHYRENDSKEFFDKIRRKHSGLVGKNDTVKTAARFLYLTSRTWNNVWREDEESMAYQQNNRYNKYTFLERDEEVRNAHRALKNTQAHISQTDYRNITPEAGDLVYCDPPYPGSKNMYGCIVDDDFQMSLARYAMCWLENGAHVVLSNQDTDFIRSLYDQKYWRVDSVDQRQNISANNKGWRSELIISQRMGV